MSEYQRVLSELYRGLETFTKGRHKLTEDTEMVGDLNMDSLQIMEVLLYVEDSFDISLPVNIVPDVKTIGELASQIEKFMRGE